MISKQAIVFAADLDFESQLMTTIKSICYHNKNIDFYLLNKEFAQEWFENLNKKLALIGCCIHDIKIQNPALAKFPTYPHISSETTFYRYFIADKINADKVLYLDIDLVVTGSLDRFFQIDLQENYIAACVDYSGVLSSVKPYYEFNAGVMLINAPLWRRENISAKAMSLSEYCIHRVPSADQSILNILFRNQWIELGYQFNYLTGAEFRCKLVKEEHKILRQENEIPLVIHYNTHNKPWGEIYQLPLREYYWYYHNLEWVDILNQHHL